MTKKEMQELLAQLDNLLVPVNGVVDLAHAGLVPLTEEADDAVEGMNRARRVIRAAQRKLEAE